ncbi:hypothetical protein ACFL35_09570 [Candidatus Riflebacteria bacterium]
MNDQVQSNGWGVGCLKGCLIGCGCTTVSIIAVVFLIFSWYYSPLLSLAENYFLDSQTIAFVRFEFEPKEFASRKFFNWVKTQRRRQGIKSGGFEKFPNFFVDNAAFKMTAALFKDGTSLFCMDFSRFARLFQWFIKGMVGEHSRVETYRGYPIFLKAKQRNWQESQEWYKNLFKHQKRKTPETADILYTCFRDTKILFTDSKIRSRQFFDIMDKRAGEQPQLPPYDREFFKKNPLVIVLKNHQDFLWTSLQGIRQKNPENMEWLNSLGPEVFSRLEWILGGFSFIPGYQGTSRFILGGKVSFSFNEEVSEEKLREYFSYIKNSIEEIKKRTKDTLIVEDMKMEGLVLSLFVGVDLAAKNGP